MSAGGGGRGGRRRLRGEEWTRAVLSLVEQVPPGRVLTYGDVAELLASGAARSVGRTMALHGSEVAWWRVVRADGTLHDALVERAAREHEREGTPRRAGGAVDLARARWDAEGWDAEGRDGPPA
ncbi:MGMT family protein [uncultured Pseudokineococcus sp.]|uniref:MGMT family protein n=1 Tax=uncultured Pseudokineococcus sp. TaxID=1642928 RepID=UPI0026234FF8|nr:MGMT family protein [uncultured Pseudokineococcus sp.]